MPDTSAHNQHWESLRSADATHSSFASLANGNLDVYFTTIKHTTCYIILKLPEAFSLSLAKLVNGLNLCRFINDTGFSKDISCHV